MEEKQIVLEYPKLRDFLETHPEKKSESLKIIDEIKCEYSDSMVKSVMKVIEKSFLKLYNDINLKLPEGFDFKKTCEDYNVVLVPNHQSHADYLALGYILYKKFAHPIYIAGGINLNFFPMGTIFRKTGAFFIRRKFNSKVYKLTFEAYIYSLLKRHIPLEFFFEGGRTRSGKLLPPKYGLFSMIFDAHSQIAKEERKPLKFIPISIAHEHIPEEKALASELGGAKKKKESGMQLFKIFNLFSKKLGTIHVSFGEPIERSGFENLKADTLELAFECFKQVGRNMPVTPSSLLALVMLDEPSGALTWKQIEESALEVIEYCRIFKIPLTESLDITNPIAPIRLALDMFINNKKIEIIEREKLNQVFYVINEEARVEILFHKNMILHHFLVPCIMNATWFNIFNGEISSAADLTKYLMKKRRELKYEFYLPSTAEMLTEAKQIISHAVGQEVRTTDEVLKFSSQDLYKVARLVRRFSSAFSYIYEGYYISCSAVKYLENSTFTEERFIQVVKDLFEIELQHGRIVTYRESFTIPSMRDTLKYLQNLDVLLKKSSDYVVQNHEKLDYLIEKFAKDINDQVSINLKFNRGQTELNTENDD